MPLPNLQSTVPTFDLTIPSNGQIVKFRPFLVKEEKLLLIALESKEDTVILNSIVEVVKACAMSPIKLEDLANFDLEYLFLQLRARSVGENIDFLYRCKNEVNLTPEQIELKAQRTKIPPVEGEPQTGICGNMVKIVIHLDEVQVETNEQHVKQIMLTDTLGINMRYPNYKIAKQILSKKGADDVDDILQTIGLCIESVFDSESVYSNFQPDEIRTWIEQLTQKQFSKVQEFFDTMPKLAHTLHFNCKSCKYQEDIRLEGLQSFFV